MEKDFLKLVEDAEKRSKKRLLIYSLIPVLLTILLILVSFFTVKEAINSVSIANEEVEEAKKIIDSLSLEIKILGGEMLELNELISQKSDSLNNLKATYDLAINYKAKKLDMNLQYDKALYVRFPKQASIINEVRNLIDLGTVKWKNGGTSIQEGFDSPGFASYLINKYADTEIPQEKIFDLYNYLPKTNKPETGDIIFYNQGYCMVYYNIPVLTMSESEGRFKETKNVEFCIGMTPIGIISLKLDFGPEIIGYGKIEYKGGRRLLQ